MSLLEIDPEIITSGVLVSFNDKPFPTAEKEYNTVVNIFNVCFIPVFIKTTWKMMQLVMLPFI
tara:strand:+ start:113 stop:301 length:189 start_codon:yes stop_codon:yes gene_type:complete